MLYVRVTQVAKLSTDHHLVACCSLQFSNPWLNRKLLWFGVAYRIKWEALADRDARKQFALRMVAKFQQLSEVSKDIEMERSLFRTAMISSAVESCERKRLRMAVGSEKRTPWWNQDIKEAIQAKKDAFKALLQNRSSSDLQSRYGSGSKNVQRTLFGEILLSVGFQLFFGKLSIWADRSPITLEKFKYYDLHQGFNWEHPPK